MTMTNSISLTDRCNYVDHTVLRRKKKNTESQISFQGHFLFTSNSAALFFCLFFFLTRHNLALTT